MTRKLLYIIVVLYSSILAQQFEIEQLTNVDAEIRNPAFPQFMGNWPGGNYNWGSPYETKLFFEYFKKAKFDTSNNIAYLKFNYDEKKFNEEILFLTDNNYRQRNVSVTTFPEYLVVWETNKNGNWDIEYTIRLNDSTWSEPKFLVNSSNDETNAKIIRMVDLYFDHKNGYQDQTWITFEMDGGIYLAEFKDSLINIEPIFSRTSDNYFINGIGCVNYQHDEARIFVAAEMASTKNQNKKVVLTDRKINADQWREYAIISDSGNSHNPNFVQIGYYYGGPFILSFEIENDLRNSTNLVFDYDWDNDPYSSSLTEIRNNQQLSTYDFNAYMYFIVTKKNSTTDFDSHFPNIFRGVRNDSTFVGFSSNSYRETQKYIHVRYDQTDIAIGSVAPYPDAMVSYMVWTDVTTSGINLFGAKRYDNLGAIGDEKIKNKITLHQNYPNPFNPTTIIKFSILHSQFTTLKIYDILGKEIKTLLNKEMLPGEYEVEFDGSDLPAGKAGLSSGVYFYRLTSGQFVQARKMLLIK